MRQPDRDLPPVPLLPAPWSLAGSAWILVLRLPEGSAARDAFLPATLAGQGRHRHSLLMFVDYAQADCGPYQELMFIPGNFPFGDGRRHLTISRILVSSWDSVVNGRRNWGIPKDRADFTVQYGVGGSREDRIELHDTDGTFMARLHLAERNTFGLGLPAPGQLLPRALRTLAQRQDDREFYYAPASSGMLRPGRLLDWSFNAALFPDLAGSKVLMAVKMRDFRMTFPVAEVRPVTAGA
jgi:hypothetical protein